MKTLLALLFTAALCIYPESVTGHGAMLLPHNWVDYLMWLKKDGTTIFDFAGVKSNLQCTAGSQIPREYVCKEPEDCYGYPHPGNSCMWFNNYTFIEKPTLDERFRTYPNIEDQNAVMHHPWLAPGSAPIKTPCGAAGGNPEGCSGGLKCGQDAGGFTKGQKIEDLVFPFDSHTTNWTRGGVVEVAWGITRNRGGGYSYRLCKLPKDEEGGRTALTEECFQQTPLRFVGDKQWVQYGEHTSTRYEFEAARTDQGTYPPGSQWTKNPIPACNGLDGGMNGSIRKCSQGTQFPAPGPGLEGYGFNPKMPQLNFPFSIFDKVQIPEKLEPGEYVLSFRWDCEQTPQVWNTCASVRIN